MDRWNVARLNGKSSRSYWRKASLGLDGSIKEQLSGYLFYFKVFQQLGFVDIRAD